jgi:hypothetical protein
VGGNIKFLRESPERKEDEEERRKEGRVAM